MRYLFVALFVLISSSVVAQSQLAEYDVYIDLLHMKDDQIQVAINTPPVTQNDIVFVFPATIPGTYEDQMWSRFVRDFKALDAAGVALPVRRSADSQFVISNAKRLRRITYSLEDSFDDRDREIEIFPPAGTSFQRDSVFVLNYAGVVGFIEQYQKLPFRLHINKPSHLFGASAASITQVSPILDTYVSPNYDALVDNPVMYSVPDTSAFDVNGVSVLVSIAHSGSERYSPAYAKTLQKITSAIGKMLPRMPVSNYAFLIYMWDGDTNKVTRTQSMFGALEHNRSSFYFWGHNANPDGLDQIAVHEFLHILVPLNVHSEEIETFNFRSPAMSSHLWLYEGVTEYFSYLALLRDSIITEDQFRHTMEQKLHVVDQLPSNFNLLEFSRNVLQPEHAKYYTSVYSYGCINALLLDITIRKNSRGKQSLLDVVYQLMDKYGPSKPFVDDKLFDTLEDLIPSEATDYLEKYIADSNRIPFASVLGDIGWKYVEEDSVDGFDFDLRVTRGLVVRETVPDGALAVQKGDKLKAINGISVSSATPEIWHALFGPEHADTVEVTVERADEDVVIKGVAKSRKKPVRHLLRVESPANSEKTSLRQNVLFGKTSSM